VYAVRATRSPVSPGHPWFLPLTHPLPHFPIPFLLASSVFLLVDPFPFYRNRPTPFPGGDRRKWTNMGLVFVLCVYWDTCRFRVLIGNNGAMHFNGYPETYNHAHSLHVFFWYNLGTIYSNAYPELYKHGHSLLVCFSHNLGTIHIMWVFLDWMLSQSADRYMNAW